MAVERCYVVRDSDGDYAAVDEDGIVYSGVSKADAGRFTRARALEVAAELTQNVGEFAPFRLIRLIPKRKPRAPREVFVLVHSHGGLDEDERPRTDRNEALLAAGSVQRVVRYVLAEGE